MATVTCAHALCRSAASPEKSNTEFPPALEPPPFPALIPAFSCRPDTPSLAAPLEATPGPFPVLVSVLAVLAWLPVGLWGWLESAGAPARGRGARRLWTSVEG